MTTLLGRVESVKGRFVRKLDNFIFKIHPNPSMESEYMRSNFICLTVITIGLVSIAASVIF